MDYTDEDYSKINEEQRVMLANSLEHMESSLKKWIPEKCFETIAVILVCSIRTAIEDIKFDEDNIESMTIDLNEEPRNYMFLKTEMSGKALDYVFTKHYDEKREWDFDKKYTVYIPLMTEDFHQKYWCAHRCVCQVSIFTEEDINFILTN